MGGLRLTLVAMLFVLAIPRARGAGGDGPQIAVAVSSTAPALAEAVGAFRAALGDDGALVFFVQLDSIEPSKSFIGGARPSVAVAFGSRASEALATSDPAVPLVVSMVMAADAALKPQQLVSTVSLSINPASILTMLKNAFP